MGVISSKTITELKNLMGDSFSEVLHVFNKSAQQCLKDLALAIEKSDVHKIEQLSHTLKGSSANIGALQLSDFCAEIVAKARNGHAVHFQEDYTKVTEEYEKVRQEIEQLLK